MELIVIGVFAGLSMLSYAVWKRSRGEGLDEALAAEQTRLRLTAAEPSLASLRPGDVVSHLGVDYVVEGAATLDDDGKVTRLYRLADGASVRWLAVRAHVEEPLLLEAATGLLDGVVAAATPEQLLYRGTAYRLAARSLARAALAGQLGGLPIVDRAWVWEYAGAGAQRILAIGWGDRVEAFAGEPIAAHLLEVLPGA